MHQRWCMGTVLVLMAAGAWALSPSAAQGPKAQSIKAIMKKANNGDASVFGQVGKQLMADELNWTDVRTKTKELVGLAESLSKTAAPAKGPKESWTKLTQEYVANVKALDAAAQKKDKDSLTAAHKKLITSCSACHKVHKGK